MDISEFQSQYGNPAPQVVYLVPHKHLPSPLFSLFFLFPHHPSLLFSPTSSICTYLHNLLLYTLYTHSSSSSSRNLDRLTSLHHG